MAYEEYQLSIGQSGSSGEKSRAIQARREAIANMLKTWKTGYDKSRGEFDYAEQGIRGRAISNTGQLTAGLASSGMLNTTAGSNAARAVGMDMQSQLTNLASQRSGAEYGKWMDLAEIQSNTPYDQMSFNSQKNKMGIGDAIGMFAGFASFGK